MAYPSNKKAPIVSPLDHTGLKEVVVGDILVLANGMKAEVGAVGYYGAQVWGNLIGGPILNNWGAYEHTGLGWLSDGSKSFPENWSNHKDLRVVGVIRGLSKQP